MHHNKPSTKNSEPEANSNNSFTISSQPWWHGVGHDSISRDMLGDSIGNTSLPREPINGGLVTKTSKSQVNSGMNAGTDATKEMLTTVVSQAGISFPFLCARTVLNCECLLLSKHRIFTYLFSRQA